MLVTPLPGADVNRLLDTLREAQRGAENVRAMDVGPHLIEQLEAYVRWVHNAVRHLRHQLRAEAIRDLLLTRRYELLIASDLGRGLNRRGLLDLEIEERISALGEAIDTLDRARRRWEIYERVVVPDSSVFIRHPDKIAEIDFAGELGAPETPVRLIIPIVVVDELDRLKEAKDRHVRWRAAHTLGVLDETLQYGAGPDELKAEPPLVEGEEKRTSRGPVTVEILLDPPSHVRLPIADDEIVDRASAINPLLPQQVGVTLMTYDTSQATRARMAGLDVSKLSRPPEPEPPEPEGASRRPANR